MIVDAIQPGESVLAGKVQDLLPFPTGAAQSRESYRQRDLLGFCKQVLRPQSRREDCQRESLQKSPTAVAHSVRALLSSFAERRNRRLVRSGPCTSVMDL